MLIMLTTTTISLSPSLLARVVDLALPLIFSHITSSMNTLPLLLTSIFLISQPAISVSSTIYYLYLAIIFCFVPKLLS
jgi:hypothetical protein